MDWIEGVHWIRHTFRVKQLYLSDLPHNSTHNITQQLCCNDRGNTPGKIGKP
jgi:hypothetical protein